MMPPLRALRPSLAAPLLLVFVGVAACDGDTGPDDPDPVTLTFVSYGGAYQQAQTDAWLEPYAVEHPNVTILQDGPTDYLELEAVPVMQFALAVSYRTDAWGGATPAGWDDFFDLESFPGTRAVRRSGTGSGILEGALIADGVDQADLYPLDVERALAKLATIVDEIVWWTDGQPWRSQRVDAYSAVALVASSRSRSRIAASLSPAIRS